MKTPEEWWDQYFRTTPIGAKSAIKLMREIQADALRHAARECRRRISTIKKTEYNVACEECATFIEAEEARAMNEP
jgi:hypothetical protein